ncbi:YceI family protein [Flavitalea sp. BT771]|uniref:YceI family protein n=1 Tax=Flavitalea sp. BT771 TaxID=3063329 RepID=UPI0026E28F76|nr:YceI family protein [Flavitalea sp. BT771]MDO6435369.1 YceI family protein [Flavitalea sp. BT771]MDV6224271.1 YceI family protein [Flavitalea sp. BT771]
MNKYIYPAIATLILTTSAFTFIATNWKIADGYNIEFSSNDASGVFKTFKGDIVFDEQNPAASKFNVSIDVASINTGNGLQNKHAKSDEWFDAAKYPQIRYVSQKVVKAGNGFQVTGDLEVHGVKRSTTIPFTFQKSAAGAVFTGSFTVNRSDFKVGKPGGDVGEQIKIDIKVPVTK